MSQPPVTRVELDTPVTTDVMQSSEGNVKRNVLSYPFTRSSSVKDDVKATGFIRKLLVYAIVFLCILGLVLVGYINRDRMKGLFGIKKSDPAKVQGNKKLHKNCPKEKKTLVDESSEDEEDPSDLIDIDEEIVSSEKNNKIKKKKAAGTNDIYFTPI